MPIELSANQSEIFFECGDLGPPDLIVASFRGREGISELFSYEIELASEDAELDFSAFVGMPATLTWSTGDARRFVNGIVASFEQHGRGARYHYYRVRLVPKAWFLTLRHNCKIFQGDDVKKIVTKTLQAAGLAENTDFTFAKYSADHPAREYCVQYRETDWDFITRLCEDEGISYFFQHEDGAHRLVFGDQAPMFETIEGEGEFLPPTEQTGRRRVRGLSPRVHRDGQRQRKFLLRDYLFTNPGLDLTSDPAEATTRTELEVYDYPGGFVTKIGDHPRCSATCALAHRASRSVARGEGDVRTLHPELQVHPLRSRSRRTGTPGISSPRSSTGAINAGQRTAWAPATPPPTAIASSAFRPRSTIAPSR
ncbi:MAG: type VI secretion system tip protein TssI/VgrG [Candidatus Eisenbacteria bacterium]